MPRIMGGIEAQTIKESSKFTCNTLSGKSSPFGISEQGTRACLGEDVQILVHCTNRTNSPRSLTYYEGHTFAKRACF